jgi:hypothetical protein
MPRSTASADSYIANLETEFATLVFNNASKQQDGLPVCEPDPIFPYMMRALTDNQHYGTLTDIERDSIIDYEIKIIQQ